MPALREVQTAFRRAIFEGDEHAIAVLNAEIDPGALSGSERIAVYRNNVFAALTDALRETFPVVCRLVDERFFSYAAHEFIAAHPPSRPALFEYGAAFPDFLAGFPPCRHLTYLPDVARLEWLMNVVAMAPDEPPWPPAALGAIEPNEAPRLRLRLQPSCRYLYSPWPIDRIWRANQEGVREQSIDLGEGGVRLEVTRRDDAVVFRPMGAADFVFRAALSEGWPLGEALERALSADTDFPAHSALMDLFRQGAVAGLAQSSTTRSEHDQAHR